MCFSLLSFIVLASVYSTCAKHCLKDDALRNHEEKPKKDPIGTMGSYVEARLTAALRTSANPL
jgi:hypothetical protein